MAENEQLEDCWEIMKCGQGNEHGCEVYPGHCPAKQQGMGHSCWVVEGVLGGDSFLSAHINGRPESCITCKVFRRYNRVSGTDMEAVVEQCPFEEKQYQDRLLHNRIRRHMRLAKKKHAASSKGEIESEG